MTRRRRYKQGVDRQEELALPTRVDDYVSQDNPVRAIDAYVESLNLAELGFTNTSPKLTRGQPAFPPQALLKLYLYGYLNRLRSSRQLERECYRNLEVIWLMEGLKPSYKTICNFRDANRQAIVAVNRDFVQLCRELDLYCAELEAIDGSFIRGNVNPKNIYTEDRLQKLLERTEKHSREYLQALEEADAAKGEEDERGGPPAGGAGLGEKLAKLRERQEKHKGRLAKLQESGEKQLAEVDEDARLLGKNNQRVAGYNAQIVVDEKHKLIVAYDVVQDGNDEQQLEPMAKAAKAVLEVEELEAVADAGYFNAQQIKNCQEDQIEVYVPEPNKNSQAEREGRFTREEFHYQEETNSYLCPAGQELRYKTTQTRSEKKVYQYRSQTKLCTACPLRLQCLPKKTPYRQVSRWEHEEVLEEHRRRMAAKGREMIAKRACLAEHPFGTWKVWWGWTHFLQRGLAKVRAEMSLFVLTYNFRRVLSILGVEKFWAYCQRRAKNRSESPVFGIAGA